MNKKLLFLALFISINYCLSAQIVVNSAILPSSGDTLTTGTDAAATISLVEIGGPQEWDFTSLASLADVDVVYQDAAEGSYSVADADLVVINGELETYYNKTNNRLELIGTFGPDALGLGINSLASYDPAQIVYDTPIVFEDENTNIAQQIFPAFGADQIPGGIIDSLGLPIAPDSVRFSLEIVQESIIDAYGTLSIPLGDFEVLRERRTDARTVLMGVKVGPFPWVDIELPVETFSIPASTAYYFWSNDAKEPLAVVNVVGEDEQITAVEFKTGENIILGTADFAVDDLNLKVHPNPAKNQVQFLFGDIVSGNYELVFHDVLGRKKKIENMWLDANNSVLIDVSELQKGVYFYTLLNEERKKLVTKELIIK